MKANVERAMHRDGTEVRYISYICGNYSRSGKAACNCHSIYENALVTLVLDHIRTHAKLVECHEDAIIDALASAQESETLSCRAAYHGEIDAQRKRIVKLDTLVESLYEDRVSGLVPESMFKRQIEKFEKERVDRLQSVDDLEKRVRSIKQNADNAATWARLIKRYTQLEDLDAETLLLLIDKIIVCDVQVIDGKRVRDIKIHYNYVGDMNAMAASSVKVSGTVA